MPENAFFGRSSRAGPQVFMTDCFVFTQGLLFMKEMRPISQNFMTI